MNLIDEWKNDKEKSRKIAKTILSSDKILNTQVLDEVVKPINEEVVSKIDCLDCGNCCRTTVTVFSEEDIAKASKFMGISKKSFIHMYLISDMGEYTTIQTPCPFLEHDNKCSIYVARPQACASFPHTQRKKFMSRKLAHENNYVVCPITYHVVKRLDEIVKGI